MSAMAMNKFAEAYNQNQQPLYDLYSSQTQGVLASPNPNSNPMMVDDLHDRFWSGWAGSWGKGGHGHGVSNGAGNSPAISALGLLAFLFFLNLIQNSLITNRWLLNNTIQTSTNFTTTSVNGGTTLVSGRKLLDPSFLNAVDLRLVGKERQKRESDKLLNRTAPDSVPTHPISRVLLNKMRENLLSNGVLEIIKSQASWLGRKTGKGVQHLHRGGTWVDASSNCFMFLACKLGRSVYSTLGDSSEYIIYALRTYVLVPKKPGAEMMSKWTFKFVEAFARGTKSSKSCDQLLKNCKRLRL